MPERFATILLPVKKGLHVLRYVSATDMVRPPRLLVMGKPGASEGLSLLFSPDATEQTLTRFDDCVAIRATHPAVLMLTAMTDPLGVSTDVELKLEAIDRADRKPSRDPAPAPALANGPTGRLMVEGHLQKSGDVRAGVSGWIGAATGEERLESFAVAWVESVKGVRLSYGCEMPGRGRQIARVPGQSVGAKGQGSAINRLFFELNGSQAGEFEFVLTAAFKGVPARTVTGQKVEIAGPTGQEPLIGFSVDVRERDVAAIPASASAAEAVPAPALVPASERGRVRVFRAANGPK
jgi:hypothetical protein